MDDRNEDVVRLLSREGATKKERVVRTTARWVDVDANRRCTWPSSEACVSHARNSRPTST